MSLDLLEHKMLLNPDSSLSCVDLLDCCDPIVFNLIFISIVCTILISWVKQDIFGQLEGLTKALMLHSSRTGLEIARQARTGIFCMDDANSKLFTSKLEKGETLISYSMAHSRSAI